PAAFADVVFAPEDSSDVAEAESVRLVIAGPEHLHDGKSYDSAAHAFAKSIVTTRGTAPRLATNTIVVLAPAQARWPDLERAVRNYLAWHAIKEDRRLLDLTQGQVELADARITAMNTTVKQRINETWVWALHPQQADGAQPLSMSQSKVDGATDSIVRTAGERLLKQDVVINHFSMQGIAIELQNHLRSRWNSGRISVGELWEFHTRYPYLARLRDKQVLLDAVRSAMTDPAWEQLGFALADGYDEATGDFVGLRLPIEDPGGPVTDATLLVSPPLARAQREREAAAAAAAEPTEDRDIGAADASGSARLASGPAPAAPASIPNAKYSGILDLQPHGNLRDQVVTLVEELLEHIQAAEPDTFEIQVTVDAGKRQGFPESTVRVVRENGMQLGLSRSRFEDL
ncbi:MAG: hypothetical protein WC580_08520, partial [Agrococcus sp.]